MGKTAEQIQSISTLPIDFGVAFADDDVVCGEAHVCATRAARCQGDVGGYQLLPWQRPVADKIYQQLDTGRIFVCGATTGAGKTYLALDAIRRLGVPALVICPKSARLHWYRVAERLGCIEALLGIVNPEQISKRTGCAYYTRTDGWKLPSNCLVVCDEWHRYATGNDIGYGKKMPVIANALLRLYDIPDSRLLILSATLADTPLKFQVLGRWMGWHSGQTREFVRWCQLHGCDWTQHGRNRYSLEFTIWYAEAQFHMLRIRHEMGDRFLALGPEDIPDFPDELREIEYLDVSNRDHAELVAAYDAMPDVYQEMSADERVKLIRCRERAEFCKAAAVTEFVCELEGDGMSVVVVVNFSATRMRVEELLTNHGLPFVSVFGGQGEQDRQRAIDSFQTNQVHVLVATIGAGGVSLSLHDELHQRQRVSLIMPGYSASDLVQAFGRIRRVGGTRAVQKIVIAADTVEERVGRILERKLYCLDALMDSDLARS